MTRVTDEPAKRHARDWLERLGLAVEPIPTTDEKRADLRATCENEEYVVEAKSRDTSEWWRALVKQAREEGSATATRSLTPWNAISSMIASAEQQLLATPSGEGAFRILWVVAEHDEDESVIYCVARRLCGTATLLVIGRNLTGYDTRDCYFYAPCDFPRRRAIDAAVLSTRKGIRLFVNWVRLLSDRSVIT